MKPSFRSSIARARPIRSRKALVGALGPTIAIFILMVMIGYAVFGPTGLYAWGDYRQSLAKKRVELETLKAQEARMANRNDLVDPRHADPDMVDELVRKELNVTDPNEVIIPRDPATGTEPGDAHAN